MKKKVKDLTDDELFDYLESNVKCHYCPCDWVLYPDGSEYTCPREVVFDGKEIIYPKCYCGDEFLENYIKETIIDFYRDEHNEEEIEVKQNEKLD